MPNIFERWVKKHTYHAPMKAKKPLKRGKGTMRERELAKAAKLHPALFLKKQIPQSAVGNQKGGHGNLCGQTKIENMAGSKKGGKGLARV